MLRYMLDTGLCIDVLSDRPAELRARFDAESDALCISTVTLAELLHGAARSARPIDDRHEVERFAARVAVLSFDAEAAGLFADIRARAQLSSRSST